MNGHADSRRADRTDSSDQRGAALPLALFAIVVLSILAAAAFLTAATELSLSRAYMDATRSLYASEEALQRYLASRASQLSEDEPLVPGSLAVTSSSGDAFILDIAQLYRGKPEVMADCSIEQRESYSLLAAPSDQAGRAVAVLIDAVRVVRPEADPDSLAGLAPDSAVADAPGDLVEGDSGGGNDSGVPASADDTATCDSSIAVDSIWLEALDTARQVLATPTYGWFEVVR